MSKFDPQFAEVRRRGGDRYAAWLAAGYRESYQRNNLGRCTPYLVQKRIRDEFGDTLYFINVWAYDWTEFPDRPSDRVTFMAEVQFNTSGDQSPTFNVELIHAETPAAAELFFRRMYDAMECEPYEQDGEW